MINPSPAYENLSAHLQTPCISLNNEYDSFRGKENRRKVLERRKKNYLLPPPLSPKFGLRERVSVLMCIGVYIYIYIITYTF